MDLLLLESSLKGHLRKVKTSRREQILPLGAAGDVPKHQQCKLKVIFKFKSLRLQNIIKNLMVLDDSESKRSCVTRSYKDISTRSVVESDSDCIFEVVEKIERSVGCSKRCVATIQRNRKRMDSWRRNKV
jgi:hypothetical protein